MTALAWLLLLSIALILAVLDPPPTRLLIDRITAALEVAWDTTVFGIAASYVRIQRAVVWPFRILYRLIFPS